MFAGSRLLLPVSINLVTLVPKPGRKEGHKTDSKILTRRFWLENVREPSLLRGIAVLRRSGSRKKRRPPVAARSGGAGAMEEQVGRKARCRAPGTRRGGCHPRGSGGVGAVRQWAGACCHPPGWWRSRERGTRFRLPSTGGAIAVRQEAEEHRAVHQRGPVPSHGTASEPLSWLRTERQCVREPDRDFNFFFNNKINKHKWKAAAPHGRLPHTKHKLKFQAWSSLLFHCCHSSFNPSEAPPWDSRPVSGAGVVHYQLLHRPRSVPTALGPAPLATYPHLPSAGRGVPTRLRSTPPPPLPGEPVRAAAAFLGVRTDEAREKEMEGWGVTEGREEKKKRWAVHSRCHAMVLDIFGGRPDAPPPPGGRRWLLQSRAAGSESPVPCSSPNMADGSRLRPPGERGRLLRSLSDGSESSVSPVLLLLQHHRLRQPLAISVSSCCPISSAQRSPSAARARWQHVPPSSRVSAPM